MVLQPFQEIVLYMHRVWVCNYRGRERERVGAVIFSFYILHFPICVSGCWHSSSSSSIYTMLFYHAWVSKFQIQFNASSTPPKGLIILGLNSKVRVQDVCVGCRGFRGGRGWGAPMNCRAAQLFVYSRHHHHFVQI
ncbi:uncharacterized protein [Malus domestica]|uniref:uncharacterized protein n=1 Tax=Malus domestica TaxID=3750 RepID=UPI003976ECB7